MNSTPYKKTLNTQIVSFRLDTMIVDTALHLIGQYLIRTASYVGREQVYSWEERLRYELCIRAEITEARY